MIPLKLELTNFLAYRNPEPLDLTGLHLACLAGENGAGKSSLLDAITWALWGKARARRDDDLIHAGEIEARVRLTFALGSNCYRVTRYRSSKGRGASLLDLEVQDGDDWRSLVEPTIRETQDRITRLLHLDYPTFINSAFLVQGRADEFTQKTPGERKAILGEILGLDVWAAYEERVKLHLRAIEQQSRQTAAEIERIDEELAREGEYEHDLAEAQEALAGLVGWVREAEAQVRALEDARRNLGTFRANYADLERRIGFDQEELVQLRAEQEQVAARIAEYEVIIAAQEEVEAGYGALQAARQQERDLSARLLEQSELREQLGELQQQVNAARSELEAEQKTLNQRRGNLLQSLERVADFEQALAEHRHKVANLEGRESECNTWREQFAALRESRADLEATNRGLKIEMDTLKSQRDQIEAATEPVCPLCRQELSDAHRADLLGRLESEGAQKAELFRAHREKIEALDAEISHLSRTIDREEGELRSLPAERDYVTRLEAQLEQTAAERAELESIEAQLASLEAALSGGAFAEEAQANLTAIQAELAGRGYDEQAHQEARQAVEEGGPYEGRKAELDHVLKALPETQAQLARLDEQAERHLAQLGEEQGRLESLASDIAALDERVAELEPWEAELDDRRDAQGQAQAQVGAAQQRLNALEAQRQRRGQLAGSLAQMAEERGIYEQLRDAFSKNGIPAMIIEAAIPDIEAEANKILSRMTDGRMHVRFDTQREKVTGGIKETLDIKIADELGTRDYETFSGGESFRVDFAIRLALSQLLARRAGAQLRTLIIDEGFGTQDAQGRERLVYAINSIQEDFDLILVITHIDELKDAFPVRIEVTKTPRGSFVEVM